MQKELRKNESILATSGVAVLAFAIWSIIKIVLYVAFSPAMSAVEADLTELQGIDEGTVLTILIVIIAVSLVDVGIRIYVGLSARGESKGKKKTILYLILAIIIAIYSVLNIVSFFQPGYMESVADLIITLVVELTSLFAVIELIVSGIKVRSLRKKIAEEKE